MNFKLSTNEGASYDNYIWKDINFIPGRMNSQKYIELVDKQLEKHALHEQIEFFNKIIYSSIQLSSYKVILFQKI